MLLLRMQSRFGDGLLWLESAKQQFTSRTLVVPYMVLCGVVCLVFFFSCAVHCSTPAVLCSGVTEAQLDLWVGRIDDSISRIVHLNTYQLPDVEMNSCYYVLLWSEVLFILICLHVA